MPRVMITADNTTSGNSYRRGDVIEASAALVTALGANARAVTGVAETSLTRHQRGRDLAAGDRGHGHLVHRWAARHG